jgi:hypothetical protein
MSVKLSDGGYAHRKSVNQLLRRKCLESDETDRIKKAMLLAWLVFLIVSV